MKKKFTKITRTLTMKKEFRKRTRIDDEDLI